MTIFGILIYLHVKKTILAKMLSVLINRAGSHETHTIFSPLLSKKSVTKRRGDFLMAYFRVSFATK